MSVVRVSLSKLRDQALNVGRPTLLEMGCKFTPKIGCSVRFKNYTPWGVKFWVIITLGGCKLYPLGENSCTLQVLRYTFWKVNW